MLTFFVKKNIITAIFSISRLLRFYGDEGWKQSKYDNRF